MRVRALLLIVLLGLLAASGPAAAQAVVPVTLRGQAHEIHVPAGWTTRVSDAGVEFVPPSGKVRRLAVALVAVESTPGTDQGTLMRKLIDGEQQRKRHLKDVTSPETIEFAGGRGTLVILSGTTTSGELEGEMLCVAVAGGSVYLFTAEGLIADMNASVDDLAAIIGGVKLAAGAGAPTPGGGGDSASALEDALKGGPPPEGGSGRGTGTTPGDPRGKKNAPAEAWLVSDPAFGIRVKPLRFWRLAIADDEYQLERTNETPAAVVAIRRVPLGSASKKAYAKKVAAGARSKDTRFAGAEALLVERRTGESIERTYHLVRGKVALVFEFRVVARGGDSGVDARVFEIEQALVLDDKGDGRWSDGAIELATYGGVAVHTAAGWSLAGVGPGRANFAGAGGVKVEVRVRPLPTARDPFAAAEEALKARCGKDAYSRADVAVLGATQAVRLRCASKKQSQVVIVASGTSTTGEPIVVQVTAEHGKKKAQPADAAIAEFAAYVSLPR